MPSRLKARVSGAVEYPSCPITVRLSRLRRRHLSPVGLMAHQPLNHSSGFRAQHEIPRVYVLRRFI